ncbi:protein of unknown function [Petrocella atlantisensis]|uniref:Uncharacterized protein n=1 Tax=Petrocella atlantisensis TaxID=2173034 RepID=A0A3P7P0Z5_9FIRM|nr:protein of unknown function [Petrocella atlantisensis]
MTLNMHRHCFGLILREIADTSSILHSSSISFKDFYFIKVFLCKLTKVLS